MSTFISAALHWWTCCCSLPKFPINWDYWLVLSLDCWRVCVRMRLPPLPSSPSSSFWPMSLLLPPSSPPPPGPSPMHRERAVEAKVMLPIPDSCLVRVPPHGGSFHKCVRVCVRACVYNFVNWACVSTLCIDIIYTIFHVCVRERVHGCACAWVCVCLLSSSVASGHILHSTFFHCRCPLVGVQSCDGHVTGLSILLLHILSKLYFWYM